MKKNGESIQRTGESIAAIPGKIQKTGESIFAIPGQIGSGFQAVVAASFAAARDHVYALQLVHMLVMSRWGMSRWGAVLCHDA